MEITEKDYSHKWFVMAAISMGILLATIDGSIVNISLPTLVRQLNTNFATVQWVVLAYLLTLAVLLLSVGRLADMLIAAGAHALFIEVAAGNTAARALYEALGFAAAGVRKGYYGREGGAEDAVVMRLAL